MNGIDLTPLGAKHTKEVGKMFNQLREEVKPVVEHVVDSVATSFLVIEEKYGLTRDELMTIASMIHKISVDQFVNIPRHKLAHPEQHEKAEQAIKESLANAVQ